MRNVRIVLASLSASVATGLLLLLAPTAAAGVLPLSRTSSVELAGIVRDVPLDDSITTNAFGAFDEVVARDVTDEPSGTHGRGSAAQNLTVDASVPDRITGGGSIRVEAFAEFTTEDVLGPLGVGADSSLHVRFEVTGEPEPFSLAGSFLTLNPRAISATVQLLRVTGENTFQTVFGFNDNFLNGDPQAWGASTLLTPGTYALRANAGAGSSGSSPGSPAAGGQVSGIDLTFSVGDTGTAVPLPPAAWASLPALLVAGIATARARRGV